MSIWQNEANKGLFEVSLHSKKGLPKRLQLVTAQREKLELALIEDPNVCGEAWYDLDITYPDKEKEIIIKGGLALENNVAEQKRDEVLKEEKYLEFNVTSNQSDWEGIMTWNFSAELVLKNYTDDSDDAKTVVEMNLLRVLFQGRKDLKL